MTANSDSPQQPGDHGDLTGDLGCRGQATGANRYRIAHNALMLAAMRSRACIIHVDGHDHGDTHCVVRIDDLVVLVEECYRSSEHEVGRALAESALEGVSAALDRAEQEGVPPSITVLRGILDVYSKAGE